MGGRDGEPDPGLAARHRGISDGWGQETGVPNAEGFLHGSPFIAQLPWKDGAGRLRSLEDHLREGAGVVPRLFRKQRPLV